MREFEPQEDRRPRGRPPRAVAVAEDAAEPERIEIDRLPPAFTPDAVEPAGEAPVRRRRGRPRREDGEVPVEV